MSRFEEHSSVTALQPLLDEITQNTRRLVQPERLALSEQLVADLFATGVEQRVLAYGTIAPSFVLPDSISGKPVRSADLLALGPVIVKFFRGRWDPYCVTELELWRDLYPEVRRHGALLVAVSPMTLRQGDFAVQQHHFPFPLLRDEDCRLAEQFGVAYPITPQIDRYYRSILVNIAFINGGQNVMSPDENGRWKLPLPATFLLGQDRRVRFAEAHADHRVRPEPQAILALL